MTDQCQKRGCEAPATKMLKFCAPGPNDTDGAEVIVGLKLCDAHIEAVDVKDFIETAPVLLASLGLEPGEEGLVYADGIPVESAEAKAFENMTQPPKVN